MRQTKNLHDYIRLLREEMSLRETAASRSTEPCKVFAMENFDYSALQFIGYKFCTKTVLAKKINKIKDVSYNKFKQVIKKDATVQQRAINISNRS